MFPPGSQGCPRLEGSHGGVSAAFGRGTSGRGLAAGGRSWRRLSGAASTRAVSVSAPWQLKRGAAAVFWPKLKWVCGFSLSR